MDKYETPTTLYTVDEKERDAPNNVAQNIVLHKTTKTPSVDKAEQRYLSASIIGPPNAGKSTFLNYMVG